MSITIKGTPETTEIHRDYMKERRESLYNGGVIAVKRQPRIRGARGKNSTFVSTEGPDNGDDANTGLEAGTSVTGCEGVQDIKVKKHMPNAISASDTAREINPDKGVTATEGTYQQAKEGFNRLKRKRDSIAV